MRGWNIYRRSRVARERWKNIPSSIVFSRLCRGQLFQCSSLFSGRSVVVADKGMRRCQVYKYARKFPELWTARKEPTDNAQQRFPKTAFYLPVPQRQIMRLRSSIDITTISGHSSPTKGKRKIQRPFRRSPLCSPFAKKCLLWKFQGSSSKNQSADCALVLVWSPLWLYSPGQVTQECCFYSPHSWSSILANGP